MAKLNISIDDQLRDELFKLIPPRRRSQVVNEALRHELMRRKRQLANDEVHRLRKGHMKRLCLPSLHTKLPRNRSLAPSQ